MAERSPVKRYEPGWRNFVMYAVMLIVDVFWGDDEEDHGAAAFYVQGPWCLACNRLWPDGPDSYKVALCKGCCACDPLMAKRLAEEARGRRARYGVYGAAAQAGVPWWRAFGLDDRPADRDFAYRAYKRALGDAHPDRGGNREQMDKVRAAWRLAEYDLNQPRA